MGIKAGFSVYPLGQGSTAIRSHIDMRTTRPFSRHIQSVQFSLICVGSNTELLAAPIWHLTDEYNFRINQSGGGGTLPVPFSLVFSCLLLSSLVFSCLLFSLFSSLLFCTPVHFYLYFPFIHSFIHFLSFFLSFFLSACLSVCLSVCLFILPYTQLTRTVSISLPSLALSFSVFLLISIHSQLIVDVTRPSDGGMNQHSKKKKTWRPQIYWTHSSWRWRR